MPPFYRVTIFLTGSRAFAPIRVLGTIQSTRPERRGEPSSIPRLYRGDARQGAHLVPE